MTNIVRVFGTIILTSALFSCAPAALPSPTPSSKPRIEKAILHGSDYLQRQYNAEVGLLRESPNVAPHKYWLFNDNALAAYALERLGEREVASNLSTTLRRYGYVTNGLEEILWGATVNWPPRVPKQMLVRRIGSQQVWVESSKGEEYFPDWMDYTNLAMLGALNEYNHGNRTAATQIFHQAIGRFDGVGFKDKAFKDEYETYKLALSLFAGLAIKAPSESLGDLLLEALLQKQAPSGGFYTHYADSKTPRGDTNTETTSLAVLALDEFVKR